METIMRGNNNLEEIRRDSTITKIKEKVNFKVEEEENQMNKVQIGNWRITGVKIKMEINTRTFKRIRKKYSTKTQTVIGQTQVIINLILY